MTQEQFFMAKEILRQQQDAINEKTMLEELIADIKEVQEMNCCDMYQHINIMPSNKKHIVYIDCDEFRYFLERELETKKSLIDAYKKDLAAL